MVLLHVGSAMRMGQEGFARLLDAIQALSKMGCAESMTPTASARLTIARLLPSKMACAISMASKKSAHLTIARLLLYQEDCATDMVAARKCATLRAARLVLLHAAVALGMARMGGARLMNAPPRQHKGSSIAPHTAVGR